MWHLDNIYRGKEKTDLSWCQRTLGVEFLYAEYQHALNALNVFKAVENCSFTVLDHTKKNAAIH